MATTKSPKRSSALVRAEHGVAPVRLSKLERGILAEAIRLGSDLADELGSKIISFGRWLLENVFENDASAALDEKNQNTVWLELVRRAGGPTLAVSRRMLYVSVRVAAHDKQITDQSWRGLDAVRKEILLPLRETARLREAAQHVSKFNLTQPKTREYVSAVLAESGKPKQVRFTPKGFAGRVRKIREDLTAAGVMRRVRDFSGELELAERGKIAGEIDKLRDVLGEMAKTLRKK